jgi:hypothetical protein
MMRQGEMSLQPQVDEPAPDAPRVAADDREFLANASKFAEEALKRSNKLRRTARNDNYAAIGLGILAPVTVAFATGLTTLSADETLTGSVLVGATVLTAAYAGWAPGGRATRNWMSHADFHLIAGRASDLRTFHAKYPSKRRRDNWMVYVRSSPLRFEARTATSLAPIWRRLPLAIARSVLRLQSQRARRPESARKAQRRPRGEHDCNPEVTDLALKSHGPGGPRSRGIDAAARRRDSHVTPAGHENQPLLRSFAAFSGRTIGRRCALCARLRASSVDGWP